MVQCATSLPVTPMMECENLSRRTFNGSSTKVGYIATAVKFKPFGSDHSMRTTQVSSIDDYSSGCRLHAGCFGHMCVTPQGNLLPPHSLSMRVGPITTEYLKAATMAFGDDQTRYKHALKKTNYTKRGHMRNIMSTPVAGSLRLVAVPQIHFPRNHVCIPPELAESTLFCAHEIGVDGKPTGRMVERCIKEGDYVMLVRPPSLTWLSTQPMTVRFWDRPCIGIKPEAFSGFHGDFDGDEAHCYPLSSPEALWEASNWVVPELDKFTDGRRMMADLGLVPDTDPLDDHASFIEFTTLSARQLVDNGNTLYFGEQSRNPKVYVDGTSVRFKDKGTEDNFVTQSVRGTMDILRQQLSQSFIGEMTRNSKIASSCFYRSPEGDLSVQTSQGRIVLDRSMREDPGSPSNRAVMLLCSRAQQSALDAHRVGSKSETGFDFIADVFRSTDSSGSDTARRTFCIFTLESETATRANSSWCTIVDKMVASLCTPSQVASIGVVHLRGSYSPGVLKMVEHGLRAGYCRLALGAVMHLYGCAYTGVELDDLAACLSYQSGRSPAPVTSREGVLARDLGWVEQLMMTDYSRLPQLESFEEQPETSTCAMYLSNFSNLTSKQG